MMEPLLAIDDRVTSPTADAPLRTQARDRRHRLLHGYLHKTSNSLCGIKGYASLIAGGDVWSANAGRWARKIIAEVDQLEAVYRSVQEMAFPERREPTGSDLGDAVGRVVTAAHERHGNLEVAWTAGPPGDLLLPVHDFEMVLTELLANSGEGDGRRTRRDRVRATISVHACDRDRLMLVLRDDGSGIGADIYRDVVHPFVTTKPGHLGIGLARVDTVMDMYGLAWSLQNRADGGVEASLEVATRQGRAF